MKKPNFLLIGAQKSGTSWLWDKISQHPATSLPTRKEIHYFGGVEKYRQGEDWYYDHFKDCDPELLIGEASTTYLYDRIPYWHNKSNIIAFDESLPSIPELVHGDMPDAKIIMLLRDPVHRALSAYRHQLQAGNVPPLFGLKRCALELPKIRLLEYGYYEDYIAAWREFYSQDRTLILNFELDVLADPSAGIKKVYQFLDLDDQFVPIIKKSKHKTWSYTRSAIAYYAGPAKLLIKKEKLGGIFDRFNFLKSRVVGREDIEFLHSVFFPRKPALEEAIGISLDHWDYGKRLIAK
ncbi:MAG: sulfotransferase domain-containing protein [Pseudomonadota bacterium]